MMKILYFGKYNSEYSRNRVLIKGLRENGMEVVEFNVGVGGWSKLLLLALKFIFFRPDFDIMLVAFPGQEAALLASFLTRKPIILDVFTSHYGGHVIDRRTVAPNSFMAKYYKWIDKTSVERVSFGLLDTDAHIDFFVKEFGLRRDKFLKVWVGTDSSVFYPRPDNFVSSFHVHFHGYFIPLQGIRTIIEAARILKEDSVTFQVIGRGQTYRSDRELAERYNLNNIEFMDRVAYEDLPDVMARAHVCLGIFGDSLKTNLVIPNKIFEAVACAKPVITSETMAIRELFRDEENILLCRKADPEDLARKIRYLKNNPRVMRTIAQNGYELFQRSLLEKKLARSIIDRIYASGLLAK